MSAIGSLVFCKDCGNLLDRPSGSSSSVTCEVCGAICEDTLSSTVVSKSKPSAFPSALRAKRSDVQVLSDADEQPRGAITQMTCEQCGRLEMRYYTMQLRGADEGTTVFYTCECGYKFNTNN
ncbi:MAG: hypothetical protein M1825_004385 [Sarcosagium campestre]|nr:MAG: hypothetical protein M1825_004385 [Sarcosagium campestre]